ncbi:MAG: IS3 family transposase [Desulfomonile tiedjei]|uniref:IS3 family transposase n=1 Tax=Desulfomonile tiedjei TaxID=2358 RepID=A0A9D6V651_9BACT|nr:IS3 family transposase [Desulfomonile tiedjei]
MERARIPHGRYSKEFREEAVRLVTEGGLSAGEASARLSLPKSTLENWVRAAKKGKLGEIGKSHRPLTELEIELAQVKRELAIVKVERDILKKAAGVLCERVAARYAMIDRMRLWFAISLLCRVLGVSASGYHAWRCRPPSRRSQEDARLEVQIRAAHRRTRQTYGPERLQRDLADHGVAVGVHRIRRLRKKLGLKCKQKRRFKATTDSRHGLPVAENLIEQRFQASAPSQVWLTDITYIPTDEGWLYLAGHKDVYTRKIVGYAMGPRMTKNLINQSLFHAVATKRPAPGLIHHSDRGSQYCAQEYRGLIDRFGMRASMSGKGNCYDNAPRESFWGTLKTELVFQRRFRTREEAIREITEYIELFYNRQRIQKKLDYLSPAAFENRFYQPQRAA